MHRAQQPKICTGCRVSAAKIYLYHSSKIAKARPHSAEWPDYTSVQSSGPWINTRHGLLTNYGELTTQYILTCIFYSCALPYYGLAH